MTRNRSPLRPATALLLAAAAALPLTPLSAQEAEPAADPPTLEVPAPEAPEPEPREVTVDPPAAPRAQPPAVEAEAEAADTAAEGTVPAPLTRAVRRAPAPRMVRVPAPAPAASMSAAPSAEPLAAPPLDAVAPPPPTTEIAPTPAPADPAAEAVPPAAEPAEESEGGSILPWLLIGLLAAGAAAFLLLRRRRSAVQDYEPAYRQPVYEEPAPLADPVAEPLAAAPLAAAPAAAPVAVAAGSAGPGPRPWIELLMRPARAGVTGADARVEFELTVDNRGTAPAEGLRIATWMLASGSSDAERMLIAPGRHAETPPMVIAAGEARTVAATVALPTSEVAGDAVLPVVVADARYTLPDGSEERVTMSYAVGVPDGRELAHFAVDNPSGLHEGVVARPLGEAERS